MLSNGQSSLQSLRTVGICACANWTFMWISLYEFNKLTCSIQERKLWPYCMVAPLMLMVNSECANTLQRVLAGGSSLRRQKSSGRCQSCTVNICNLQLGFTNRESHCNFWPCTTGPWCFTVAQHSNSPGYRAIKHAWVSLLKLREFLFLAVKSSKLK